MHHGYFVCSFISCIRMRAIPCNIAQFRAILHFQFSIFSEIPKKRWIWFGFLTGIELDPIANLRIPLVYVVSRSTVLEQCHAITHFSPNWLAPPLHLYVQQPLFLLLRVLHSCRYFRTDPVDKLTCKYVDDFASSVSRGAATLVV